MKTFFYCVVSLLLCAAWIGESGAQPAKAWGAPVDASIVGCYDAKAQATLMDDGSLLVVCVANFLTRQYNNAPLWQRGRDGAWRIAAQPPTRTSRALGVRKLSGNAALVTWADPISTAGLLPSHFQVWTSGSGAAPAFRIPGPAEDPGAGPISTSWGLDERAVRIRSSRVGEVPVTPGVPATPLASVVELVDRAGQAVGPGLPLPGRYVRAQPASACLFPNGDRLVAFTSVETKGATAPYLETDVQAAIHRKGGGWEGPFFLFANSGEPVIRTWSFCPADGVAKVIGMFAQPGKFYFTDLAGADGWRPMQQLNADGLAAEDMTVLYAQSGSGRAALAWNDKQGAPAGLTGEPAHKSIPRVQWIDAGSRYFSTDFNTPKYNPDATEDAAINAVAWDPKRERFVFVLTGGAGPSPRRSLADLSPRGLWSVPTPLPGQFLRDWQLDFNASGDGVLLGQRHGQLLISDWR